MDNEKNDIMNFDRKNYNNFLLNNEYEMFFHVDTIINEHTRSIQCSVLTYNLIEYDKYIFDNLKNDDDTTKIFNTNYHRPYFVFFNIDYDDYAVKSIFEKENKWFKGKILNNANENTIPIQLICAFSPIKTKGKYLLVDDCVNDEKINSIIKTYEFDNDEINKKILKSPAYLDEYLNYPNNIEELIVYRIGDGNCNYIKFADSAIFYDIGYNVRCIPKYDIKQCKYQDAVADIRAKDVDLVIISHWDMDHFIGCAYCRKSIFDVGWFSPIPNDDVSVNAKRLIKYLMLSDRIRFINNQNQINSKLIKINIGNGKDKNVTPINCNGLYLTIEDKILLSGDVPYKCMGNDIVNKDYSLLVVPHHGGKMETLSLNTPVEIVKNKKIAIISTNLIPTKRKGKSLNDRPDPLHRKFLDDCGYTVYYTENEGNNIGFKIIFDRNCKIKSIN